MDQSPESTGGKTKSEITKPVVEVGKAKIEGEKVSDREINEAATSLGLTKVRADTIKKLRDIGVAAEQCGAIKVALGRVLVCDDRLDSLMDVVLDVAQNSNDSDQRVKAATAGTSIAQQISKNADLVYKFQSENLIRDGGEKRKFHSFGPEHVVIPVHQNVQVNLAEEPKT